MNYYLFVCFAFFKRFHSTNVEGATLKTIQLRVVGTIKSWLETFFDDFSDDQSLQDALKDFLQTIIPVMGQPAQQILTLLQKGGNRNVSEESSIAPKENINFDDLHFEDLDENEIANQLCMREFKIYSAILVNEILNLNWSKHKERSPNVLALIEQFNRVFPFSLSPFFLSSLSPSLFLISSLLSYCYWE